MSNKSWKIMYVLTVFLSFITAFQFYMRSVNETKAFNESMIKVKQEFDEKQKEENLIQEEKRKSQMYTEKEYTEVKKQVVYLKSKNTTRRQAWTKWIKDNPKPNAEKIKQYKKILDEAGIIN